MNSAERPSVRKSLRVAARGWRSEFWLVTALLAVLPALWELPRILLSRSGVLPAGRLSEFIVSMADAIWWSPVLAGQIGFCIVLNRRGTATLRSFLNGLRQTPRNTMFWILVFGAIELSALVPTSSGDDLQWHDGLSIALPGVLLFGISRVAFTPAIIEDLGIDTLSALHRSWVVTRGRLLLVTRFFVVIVIATGIIYLVVGRQADAAAVASSLSVGPLISLGYVALYLSISPRPHHVGEDAAQEGVAADGATPRS